MTFAFDLRDLHYFETIAELEHVGRAADRLNRTQPALTSCVRRLEEICGAPLFERAGRGIRLTPAGKLLLKWARRIRLDVEDASSEFGNLGKGLTGHIRIGLVPTAAHFLFPPIANQLLQEAPEITLHTEVGLVSNLRPLLNSGAIDLMIGTEGISEDGLESRLIAEDDIVVAASRSHEIFERQPRLKDLSKYGWALQPPGVPTRDWLDNFFDRYQLGRPVVKVESTMLLALPALIAQTGLLSFISRHHLTGNQSGGLLREVPIDKARMTRRLVLTYRANCYHSPVVQRLIDLLLTSNNY